MNPLDRIFGGRKALIFYLMAGDPDRDATVALARTLEEAGADALELGMPFSDPQADGPVIQAAANRALRGGATLGRTLETAAQVREATSLPLLLMGYLNPLLAYGTERFARDAAASGVSGVLLPDLPFDEGEEVHGALRARGVPSIPMAAPNTPEARLSALGRTAPRFVYCVSLLGTTGSASSGGDLESYLGRVGRLVPAPRVLGFGIRDAQGAARGARHAEGVVVGSALVERVARHAADPGALRREVGAFAASLREALDRGN